MDEAPEPNQESVSSFIEHVGILVPDLEGAIERWSKATGFTFSPIARYRTHRYVDHSGDEHFHDARISFSREGGPRIELMEVTGTGTHGPQEVGVHHFGFQGIVDLERRLEELTSHGIGHDGMSYDAEGRMLLCFTDKSSLDGVRLEFISPLPGPIVRDDGTPLPVDPRTGKPNLWANG